MELIFDIIAIICFLISLAGVWMMFYGDTLKEVIVGFLIALGGILVCVLVTMLYG